MAHSFYLDASALAKRYVPEEGSAHVDAILDTVLGHRIYVLNIGTGEALSILVRKRNAGFISVAEFARVAVSLIVAHSINATHALTLKSALAIARKLRAGGDDLVLVASDQRLLRAAQAEGPTTFNPESQDHAALSPLLGP